MDEAEFWALVAQLRGEPELFAKHNERLFAVAAQQDWFDSRHRRALEESLPTGSPLPSLPPLRRHQAWVLVCENGKGKVARLSVCGEPPEGATAVSPPWDALRAAAARAGRYLPDAGSLSPWIAHKHVAGASYELSACAAMVAHALGLDPPSGVATSACVAEDGRLRPVERLADKLEALREMRDDVRLVVVAKNQEWPGPTEQEIKPLRAGDVVEALDEMGLRLPQQLTSQLLDERLRHWLSGCESRGGFPRGLDWANSYCNVVKAVISAIHPDWSELDLMSSVERLIERDAPKPAIVLALQAAKIVEAHRIDVDRVNPDFTDLRRTANPPLAQLVRWLYAEVRQERVPFRIRRSLARLESGGALFGNLFEFVLTMTVWFGVMFLFSTLR